MSRTAAAAALTAEHRRQQLALRAATVQDLLTLWPAWNPAEQSSWERFLLLAVTLVRMRHGQSAALASAYYERFRAAEHIPGRPTVVLPEDLADEQVIRSLTSTGLVGTIRALSAGFTPEAALRNGFVRAAGAAGRLALDGGRAAVIESTRADRRSGRWARVTSGDACEFCQMLEGRGAVYSESSADFESHDHCACTAEPVYA